jgi:nucleotide-binding universal stress UspA family protein
MIRFKKILCPVDFDANSLGALRLASDLAKERKAALRLVHVIARLARQRIDGKARYAIQIMMGDPGVEVLQAAKRWGADAIVMATHGRKGLRHLVLGSVAEHVVREASCPVVTLSPKATRGAALPKR